jgi:uncharacterized protein with beta-barrel porin domain
VSDISATTTSLVYGANDVTLLATGPTFQAVGSTTNQKGIGAIVDTFQVAGSHASLVDYLSGLSDADLRTAYDKISPANLGPMYRMEFAAAQTRSGAVGNRLSQLFASSRSDAYASWNGGPMFAADLSAGQEAQMAKGLSKGNWGLFVDGIGSFGTVSVDSSASGYQFSTGGTTAGVDYRFDKEFVGGLLFGYGQSGIGQSTASVDVKGGQVGLYAGLKKEELHAEALLEGGIDNYTTQRASVGGTAVGSTQGLEYTAQLNVGYDLKASDLTLSPFVSGQFTQVDITGFSETGSLAPLTYGNQGEGYISSRLGTEVSVGGKIGSVQLSPMVSAAWEHVYQGVSDKLTADMGSGSTFAVSGSALGADAAILGGGVQARLDNDLTAHVEYQGKVAMTNYTAQSLSGGLHLGF